ncbi:MAG: two-component system response regulator OmpR [Thioalkalispiraceae bacterium]|jgi:DNA-binding response OmpR family regulator
MQDSANKILVVDDDHRLRDLLERYLQEQGFEVKVVADGKAMDKALAREYFKLIVLDLMLPGEDGLSICRRLRGQSNDIPILMLTAKGDEVDRIVGLEIGADDYLPKPFNPRELVARINAILRRHNTTPAGAPEEQHIQIQIGNYVLDLGTRLLSSGDDRVSLTTGQYALLKALVTQPHKPLSRDALMAQLNERDYENFDRSIDVQISRLRKIVEEDPKVPRYIQTVWGHGYVFVPDGEAPA